MSEENLAVADMMGNNETFQPSVWIESLASILASFLADPRLRYAHGVQPNVVDGELCLLVATWLETTDRATHDHVMDFSKANRWLSKTAARVSMPCKNRLDARALKPAYQARRCRTASNTAIAKAAEAFRDSIFPGIGI